MDVKPGFGVSFPKMYQLAASKIPDHSVAIEMGVQFGYSLNYLARCFLAAGKPNVKIIGVDLWMDDLRGTTQSGKSEMRFAERNLADVTGMMDVRLIRDDAIRYATLYKGPRPSFVFLDNCHEYWHVRHEISLWIDRIKPGGLLAGHDYANVDRPIDPIEVKRAVDDAGLSNLEVDEKEQTWWSWR